MDDPRLRSKWWRLTHLYKIKDKQGNLVRFKPNYPQTLHLVERERDRVLRLLLVKARQFGFTTLYAIDMLDDACFEPGSSCVILAHERESVDKIFTLCRGSAFMQLRATSGVMISRPLSTPRGRSGRIGRPARVS